MLNGWQTPDFNKALNLTSLSSAEPLRDNLEGRASYLSGSDPIPKPRFEIPNPLAPENNPLANLPGSGVVKDGISNVVTHVLAGAAGIVIIAIGLAAVVFAGKSAALKTVTG